MRVAVLAVAALAVVGVVLAAGGAGAQTTPTVTVTDATVAPGETTVVQVRLTAAPAGVAGYDATVTVDGAATVVDANVSDQFGLTNATVVDDATVRLRGADTDGAVQNRTDAVTVARLVVRGDDAGTATVSVDGRFDADDGSRIDPATESGTVRVAAETGTATGTQTTETAADGGGDATESPGDDGETAAGGPGLGVVAALLALVVAVAGVVVRCRRP